MRRWSTAEMLELSAAPEAAPSAREAAVPDQALDTALGTVERARLLEALDETYWNVTRAARRLGISRDTLRYRIAKHGLRPGGSRTAPPPEPAVPPPSLASPSRAAIVPDAPASAVRWEQRRVTFLRAVIDGPPLDDDRLYPSRMIETLIEKARSFGGRVEDLGPTGIVAVFGLEPVEDAARRAAHAAVAIRRAVERGRRAEAPRITVRLGIHVAPLLVGYVGRDIRLELDGKRRAWQTLEGLVVRADPDGTIVSDRPRPSSTVGSRSRPCSRRRRRKPPVPARGSGAWRARDRPAA